MATADGNKELVRRLYGGLMAKGDTTVADQVLADDYLDHDIPGVGEGGRRELVAAVLAVRASFPDIVPTLDPVLAEADLVAVRVQASGTHTGAPFPPGNGPVHDLEGGPHLPLRRRPHRRALGRVRHARHPPAARRHPGVRATPLRALAE
jgi:predicted SnoaL-like aldol condensation-catalyzing enzyme